MGRCYSPKGREISDGLIPPKPQPQKINFKRQLAIKNKYMQLAIDKLTFYGFGNEKESKEDLADLMNDTVKLLVLALENDDKTVIYKNHYKKYNILLEEIEDGD